MATARKPLTVLVLAAGKGKRFRSTKIKLLHEVAGRPMLELVLDTASTLKPTRLITVVGYQAARVREAIGKRGGTYVEQKAQRGTGHAVNQAAKAIPRGRGSVLLILNGDVPAIRPATLRRLITRHRNTGAALSVLTTKLEDATGYGRIVRDRRGRFLKIVEHADATAEEREVSEINSGIYCADPSLLLQVLRRVRPNNAQGEYYVTDAAERLLADGKQILAVCHPQAEEVLGVNNREELARAAAILYSRKAAELQERGVTLLDALSTRIDPRARIGRDTVLHPGVTIEGPSVIGPGCVVRTGCRLVDCRVGRGAHIMDYSILTKSRIGPGATVGPFAQEDA